MLTNPGRALRAGGALAALAIAVALLVAQPGRAQAQIDVTGDWDVSVEGDMPGSCEAAIQQTATDVFAALDCDLVGSVIVAGTIDPVTGDFTLSGDVFGYALDLQGTASEDGSSISGSWTADIGFSGTFTGTRTSDTPSFVDLSGNWDFLLWGALSTTCAATFEQSLDDLSATMDCGDLGSGSLTGSANPITGAFDLSGMLDGSSFWLNGFFLDNEGAIHGSWFSDGPGEWGDFIAVREGGLAAGAMAVDCDAEYPGVQQHCSYPPGYGFGVQVLVLAPPAGGYVGFSSDLGWTEDALQYSPAADPLDEALWPPCDDAQRSISDAGGLSSVAFACASQLAEADTSTGAVVRLQMQCPDTYGWTELGLVSRDAAPGQGTYFVDGQGSLVDPLLLDASVGCYEPGRGGDGSDGPGRLAPPGDQEDSAGDATVTPTQSAATPVPTATPSADVLGLALPDTGGGPGGASGSLPLLPLLAFGAAALALCGLGLRLRRRRIPRA